MSRKVSFILHPSSFILCVLLAIASASGVRAAEPVRIGFTPITANSMVFVAKGEKWFEKRGVAVEFKAPFRSTNDSIEAFLRGEVDVSYCPSLDVALGAELRAPGTLRFIGFSTNDEKHWYEAFLVAADSPIKSMADLEGKRIGCFRSPFAQQVGGLLVKRALAEGKKFEMRPLDFNVQADALLGGQVDALFAYEPRISQLVAGGQVRVLEEGPLAKRFGSPFPGAVVIMRADFLAKHRADAEKFLAANSELLSWCAANYEKTIPAIAEFTGMTTEADRKLLATLRQSRFQTTELVDRKALQRVADLLADAGVIPKRVESVERLIQDSPKGPK